MNLSSSDKKIKTEHLLSERKQCLCLLIEQRQIHLYLFLQLSMASHEWLEQEDRWKAPTLERNKGGDQKKGKKLKKK